MAFNLFRKASPVDAEGTFWQWFIQNENRLHALEADQEVIFDEILAAMHKVHEDLTFEFSPISSDGQREFVISADGIQAAFPAVEALYQTAPKLERWKWIKSSAPSACQQCRDWRPRNRR